MTAAINIKSQEAREALRSVIGDLSLLCSHVDVTIRTGREQFINGQCVQLTVRGGMGTIFLQADHLIVPAILERLLPNSLVLSNKRKKK